jgi:hypothetical protein
MKKNHSGRCNLNVTTAASLVGVLATTAALLPSARGFTVPPVAPIPILWKGIADTCSNANSFCSPPPPGAPLTTFLNIGPPVLAQQAIDVYAFKARIQSGVLSSGLAVNLTNDEGIWGNGGPVSQGAAVTLTPWLIAREGDPVPTFPAGSWGLMGRSNVLNVRGLQVSASGQTIATVNTDAPGIGRAYLFDNCCLQTLAASGPGAPLPFRNLQTVVTDSAGAQLAGWAKNATPQSGTLDWTPLPFSPPCTVVPGGTFGGAASWTTNVAGPTGGLGTFLQIPTHLGSPAISERGIVAHFAVDSGPAVNRPHIRIDRNTTWPGVIVRRGWPSGVASHPRFGNFHSMLMAVCENPAPVEHTVAWQMLDMRLTPAGAPIPGSTSLWAKCNVGPYHLIAMINQPAPDLAAGDFFGSFHALHVANTGTLGDSLVFFGTKIIGVNTGKTAIYVVRITGGTTMGPLQLIATDAPGFSPVIPISTGPTTIGTLFPYFSTNASGDVLMKATLAVAPPAQSQVLITANALSGHPLSVRSQSGQPITPPTCATGVITNFTIANPEQGCFSRGQAINSLQAIGARINFTGGHGAFIGF